MFGQLFVKECKQTAKSLIYYIFVICIAVFYFSQLGNMSIDEKPLAGEEDYGRYGGRMKTDDEKIIMENALTALIMEYYYNDYTTYPLGFSKHVKLNEKEQAEVGNIITQATGLSDSQIEQSIEQASQEAAQSDTHYFIPPRFEAAEGISYSWLQKELTKIDEMLGGGSGYSVEQVKDNATVSRTYEAAREEYDNLIEKDKVTGGFARLFCDYMGIVLGFLPVFLAVTRGLRDRRSGMKDLVAVRKASSFVIVSTRCLAMVFMMFLPVLLLTLHPLAQCIFFARSHHVSIQYFSFIIYSIGWLLPDILFTSAVGVVLTELTDSPIAAAVMGIWWFADVNAGVSGMGGGSYGLHLIARHNTEYNYKDFIENFGTLAANRLMYTVLAFVLLMLAVLIYSRKRKGRFDIYGKIFGNRKRASEV